MFLLIKMGKPTLYWLTMLALELFSLKPLAHIKVILNLVTIILVNTQHLISRMVVALLEYAIWLEVCEWVSFYFFAKLYWIVAVFFIQFYMIIIYKMQFWISVIDWSSQVFDNDLVFFLIIVVHQALLGCKIRLVFLLLQVSLLVC